MTTATVTISIDRCVVNCDSTVRVSGKLKNNNVCITFPAVSTTSTTTTATTTTTTTLEGRGLAKPLHLPQVGDLVGPDSLIMILLLLLLLIKILINRLSGRTCASGTPCRW